VRAFFELSFYVSCVVAGLVVAEVRFRYLKRKWKTTH